MPDARSPLCRIIGYFQTAVRASCAVAGGCEVNLSSIRESTNAATRFTGHLIRMLQRGIIYIASLALPLDG
jgi:hypothetical protein